MDLQPGEEIVFEGHRSWRAILGFYVVAAVDRAVRQATPAP